MMEPMAANKDMMMKKIQQLQFMAVELNLYLDTHPTDMRALAQYNSYTGQLMMAKKQYEQMYGPLMGFGCAESASSWKWIYEKWPWEYEAEGGMK